MTRQVSPFVRGHAMELTFEAPILQYRGNSFQTDIAIAQVRGNIVILVFAQFTIQVCNQSIKITLHNPASFRIAISIECGRFSESSKIA